MKEKSKEKIALKLMMLPFCPLKSYIFKIKFELIVSWKFLKVTEFIFLSVQAL